MRRILLVAFIFAVFLTSCSTGNGNSSNSNDDSTKTIATIDTSSDKAEVSNDNNDNATVSSEITAQNASTISINENSTENSVFKSDFSNIKEIMSLKKEDIFNRLGKDYKVIQAGAENSEEGYNYEQYGITIIFDDFSFPDMIGLIKCNEKVDINGTKLGMTFSEIEKILGKGESRTLEQIELDQPNFALYYKFDNFIIWFGAAKKDGATTDLQIRRNDSNN